MRGARPKRPSRAVGVATTGVAAVPAVKRRRRSSASADSEEREEAQPAASSKEPKKYEYLFGLPPLVSVTGASAGDILEGSAARAGAAKGTRLQVASGRVSAWSELRQLFDRQHFVKCLAQWRGVSFARAEQIFDEIPTDNGRPNHEPLGKACSCAASGIGGNFQSCKCEPEATLRILEAGPLMQHALEAGTEAELEELVQSQREVSWREVLPLLGKHTLSLRRSLYHVASGPKRVKPSDEAVDLTGGAEPAEHWELELQTGSVVVRVASTAAERPSVAEALDRCRGACARRSITVTDADFEACRALLEPLSLGGLKSAQQKCLRYGARTVELPSRRVPAGLFAAMACALMFAHRGVFSPELQLFTRGCTAALKRTAVILVEDAWVPGAPLAQLLAAALLCQVVPSWNPPAALQLRTLELCIDAAASSEACDLKTRKRCELGPEEPQAEELRLAARLLRTVRSFKGDMDMFDAAARLAALGRLPCQRCSEPPVTMPACHVVDQHAYRGVGHAIRGLGADFEAVFAALFTLVTGVNPRRQQGLDDFESRPAVRAARFAQTQVLRFATAQPREQLEVVGRASLHVVVDAGVLAAAVGPLSVSVGKRTLLVTLGSREPADEVVMRKPSRDTKDLYTDISDKEKLDAIGQVRAKPQRLHTPFPLGTWASFEDGEWWVGQGPSRKRWSEVVRDGLEVQHALHPAPAQPWRGVDDDTHLEAALAVVGNGLVEGAEAHICTLRENVPQEVLLRAASLVHQQYERVALPTPALSGGQSGEQLMAYPGDQEVYRLLVAVSRLAPGALRPEQLPNFSVPQPMLLLEVQRWLCSSMGAGDSNGKRWAGLKVDHSVLMPHQRDAVRDMLQRDIGGAPGHFVVMDTGYGKTLTALSYIRRFLDGCCVDVRHVLWVAPTELVGPTVAQLRDRWGAPACELPADGCPCEAHINVCKHDRLRKLSRELAAAAPRMLLVLDEADTMYAATQRTSAAHRIAALCPKLICQTATPLRSSKHEQLAEWLQRTERFPVDRRNWLVAANGMISKQIDLGIAVEHIEREVPMADELRRSHLSGQRDWLRLAQATQEATDAPLVEEAVRRAAAGVLLVGNDRAHVERLLQLLRDRGVAAGDFEQRGIDTVRVVVVTKRHCRGYNEAARLGALVTGVYAGNGADRHQLLGRLKRIGQRRPKVEHVTVYTRNSILHLLHLRHQSVDTLNISLAALGEHYGAEVLRMAASEG